jgi:hypothetical protein
MLLWFALTGLSNIRTAVAEDSLESSSPESHDSDEVSQDQNTGSLDILRQGFKNSLFKNILKSSEAASKDVLVRLEQLTPQQLSPSQIDSALKTVPGIDDTQRKSIAQLYQGFDLAIKKISTDGSVNSQNEFKRALVEAEKEITGPKSEMDVLRKQVADLNEKLRKDSELLSRAAGTQSPLVVNDSPKSQLSSEQDQLLSQLKTVLAERDQKKLLDAIANRDSNNNSNPSRNNEDYRDNQPAPRSRPQSDERSRSDSSAHKDSSSVAKPENPLAEMAKNNRNNKPNDNQDNQKKNGNDRSGGKSDKDSSEGDFPEIPSASKKDVPPDPKAAAKEAEAAKKAAKTEPDAEKPEPTINASPARLTLTGQGSTPNSLPPYNPAEGAASGGAPSSAAPSGGGTGSGAGMGAGAGMAGGAGGGAGGGQDSSFWSNFPENMMGPGGTYRPFVQTVAYGSGGGGGESAEASPEVDGGATDLLASVKKNSGPQGPIEFMPHKTDSDHLGLMDVVGNLNARFGIQKLLNVKPQKTDDAGIAPLQTT